MTFQNSTPQIVIQRGTQPSAAGSADCFTGRVQIEHLFSAHVPARASGSAVTFEPGARTAWHSHPQGQTLIVTSGRGLVQEWGGPVREILPGDVVWFPPEVRHWHGAAPDCAMSHLSICEALEGKNARWMEKVTDAQYGAPHA